MFQEKPKIAHTPLGDIEYAEYGGGPAVITIHGAMGGYDQSLILGRTIGDDGYRYIGISRPGYLGTPIKSGRSPEQQADLCAALMDNLGIDKALVMAVSGGGPCALFFALRHHDRCKGLVLVSTCGQKVDTPIPFSFRLTKLMLRVPGLARSIERKALENMDKAVKRSIPDPGLCEQTLNDPETGPLFKALMISTFDRMSRRIKGTENDIKISRTTEYPLEDITVPAFVVHGTADKMLHFADHGKVLASRISGAQLLTVNGGEHVSIFTHREMVRERVVPFMHECLDD